jgi:prefoldin alpha subunit
MEDREEIIKINMIEQELEELGKRIEILEEQTKEIGAVRQAVSSIEGSEKEMLASLGKGVFLRANIIDKNPLVNVGSNILIKKTPQEIKEAIDSQEKIMEEAKHEINERKGQLEKEKEEILTNIQKKRKITHK